MLSELGARVAGQPPGPGTRRPRGQGRPAGLGCWAWVGKEALGQEAGLSAASTGWWKGHGTGNLGPAGDITETAGLGSTWGGRQVSAGTRKGCGDGDLGRRKAEGQWAGAAWLGSGTVGQGG